MAGSLSPAASATSSEARPTELAVALAGFEQPPETELAAELPDLSSGLAPDPMRARVKEADEAADARDGRIAFAIVEPDGRLRGRSEHDLFHSASVVKSMLLAAELDRLGESGEKLDPATRDLLRRMITISDNDAAAAIYERVGDAGLRDVARRAGMSEFEVEGSWGYARISAADMARLFSDLDAVIPERYEKFGEGLLGSIVAEQSWGIPAVAEDRGWAVRFKGGWRETPSGQLVSQAAELRSGDRSMSMAILTDGQTSMAAGIDSVEAVAAKLVGDRPK